MNIYKKKYDSSAAASEAGPKVRRWDSPTALISYHELARTKCERARERSERYAKVTYVLSTKAKSRTLSPKLICAIFCASFCVRLGPFGKRKNSNAKRTWGWRRKGPGVGDEKDLGGRDETDLGVTAQKGLL
jgi:hypothetical protein